MLLKTDRGLHARRSVRRHGHLAARSSIEDGMTRGAVCLSLRDRNAMLQESGVLATARSIRP